MDSFVCIREMLQRAQKNSIEPTDWKQIKDEVLRTCQKHDRQVKTLTDNLLEKTHECQLLLKEHFDAFKELVSIKESAGVLVKYLNSSLKSSSIVVARSIIEMTCKSELHNIVTSAEAIANDFRRDREHITTRNWLEILREAKRSRRFESFNSDDREAVEIYCQWFAKPHEKNRLPTRQVLSRIWRRAKPAMIVTVLNHPRLGGMTEERRAIELAFGNLYQRLSDNVHNCTLTYQEDVLPIPEVNDNTFTKADALALASFYSISLPGVPYALATNVPPLPLGALQCIPDSQRTTQATTKYDESTTNTSKAALKRTYEQIDENDAAVEQTRARTSAT